MKLSPMQRNQVLADSQVGWREFARAMKKDMRQAGKLNDAAPTLDSLYSIFNELDDGHDNILETDEIRAVFERLVGGKDVPQSFVDDRLAKVDLDKSGSVDFGEYVEMITGNDSPGLGEVKLQYDALEPDEDGNAGEEGVEPRWLVLTLASSRR